MVLYRLFYFFIRLAFNALSFLSGKRIPPMVASGAIVEQDGCILLLKRSDGLGFSLPGGLLHWEETAVQAAEREVKEETGYDVQATTVVGVYGGPDADPRFNCVVIVYAAEVIGGTLEVSNEGTPVWIPKTELPTQLAFKLRPALDDYLRQQALASTHCQMTDTVSSCAAYLEAAPC